MSAVRLATGEIVDDEAGNWADRAVNFGGYRPYHFSPKWPHNGTPLTRKPRVVDADTTCLCDHCRSEGFYAQSPVCRFWRAHCEVCSGRRVYPDYSDGRPPRLTECDLCAEEWPRAVRFFMDAIRSPRNAARKLRDEAVREAARQRADSVAFLTRCVNDPTASDDFRDLARGVLADQLGVRP